MGQVLRVQVQAHLGQPPRPNLQGLQGLPGDLSSLSRLKEQGQPSTSLQAQVAVPLLIIHRQRAQ